MALPFLPGMSFRDPSQTSYARTQTLNFRNGAAVHDARTRSTKDEYMTKSAPPPPGWKTASGETPPPWIAYEKKVLNFESYFMEVIPYSRDPYRIRKCLILFHLEDGTLSILEPKVQNSGITQGTLVRRHKATKEDGTPLTYQDINTCMDLKIHGIKYRIYETTDPYTIQFMEEMGFPINGFEPCPGDPHTDKRDFMVKSLRPVRAAKTGTDPLRQFLDNDGKVLRFYCLMDDPRNRFQRRTFMLQYFLADDTISVVENLPPNCGRDASPMFAKRQSPPKGFPSIQDVTIGGTISLFNRKLLVYDVDSFTREYFRENFGVEEFIPIDISAEYAPVPRMDIPKHNGFGTEEDSLNSYLSLVPKPLKRDVQKSIENDKMILRFSAKLNSTKPINASRVFVISFFLADDTISVYEPPQRNSGIVGGKFLERRRVKRPLKPPTLVLPSSPARPYTAPNFSQSSTFSRTRSVLPQSPEPDRPSTSSSPSRSASPFSFSSRGYGFATTSGAYGHDPRKGQQTPPSTPPPRSPSSPSRSPSNTPPPPARNARPASQQAQRSRPTSLVAMARTIREEEKSRVATSHEELQTEYYCASDFYIGGLIQIFHHVFVLQDADEYALRHMESRPDEFPVSDINRIIALLRQETETKEELAAEWLRELDPERSGYIPRESFKEFLQTLCPDLVEQELLTVCRRYDLDGKGQISYEEFYTAVAHIDDF